MTVTIRVSSSPVAADISIQNLAERWNPKYVGKCPLTFTVSDGQYYVIAYYPEYELAMNWVNGSKGGDFPIKFSVFPAQPKPPVPPISMGKLDVKAFYKGKEIYLRVTVLPWMVFYAPKIITLPVGAYTLTASIWWRKYVIIAQVEKDITKPVTFNF